MNWLDCAGPPGSGKSTIADHFWGPHAIPIEDRLPPVAWQPFLGEVSRLFHLIREHPTLPAALRMVNRSVRKIATVARMPQPMLPPNDWVRVPHPDIPYIQTALAQRGLGFGWRMVDLGIDINELRHYFRLMPVSIGVVVTRCPQEIVEARNHARKLVPATAHEDRAHMVALMQPAIELAIEVLRGRNVPVWEIDTTQPVEAARAQVLAFADQEPFDPEAGGHSSQVPVLSPPDWWIGPASGRSLPLAHTRTFGPPFTGWTSN